MAAGERPACPARGADLALPPSAWGKRQRPHRRVPAGFTLLEILVALGVLGIIMSAVYGSYRAVSTSIVGLQPRIALDQTGRFFLQRLARQIRCCYSGRPNVSSRSTRQRNEEDSRASQERVSLFESGQTATDDIVLRFVTTGGVSTWKLDSECLIVVSYKLDKRRNVLLTDEQVYGQRDEDSEENWRVILEDVAEIEVEYFDGIDWQAKWDSDVSGGPPRAVRVRVVLESPEQSTASFTTVAPIRCCARRESKTREKKSSTADNESSR